MVRPVTSGVEPNVHAVSAQDRGGVVPRRYPLGPVPDLTEQTSALVEWLSTNGVVLAVVAIVLLLVYRWARPAIHGSWSA